MQRLIFNRMCIVFLFLWGLIGSVNSTTLAVLDFQNNTFIDAEQYANLSRGLADIMITELGQIQAIQVVERSQFKALHEEMNLSQSGMIDEQQSIQIGKMLGARQLVFGGYMVTGKKVRIDVRIVEVETGITIKASEVTGKVKDVLKLVGELSEKICQNLNVQLTRDERQTLTAAKDIDPEALMLFSRGVAFEDGGNLQEAKICYIKALRMAPEFRQAKIRARRLVLLERKNGKL